MCGEIDIHIAHGYHLAGIVESTFNLDVGQGTIPGHIDLAFDKRLDQGVIVRIENPVEVNAVPSKVGLEPAEDVDIGWRCCATKPYHTDLLFCTRGPDAAGSLVSSCICAPTMR